MIGLTRSSIGRDHCRTSAVGRRYDDPDTFMDTPAFEMPVLADGEQHFLREPELVAINAATSNAADYWAIVAAAVGAVDSS